MPAGLEYCRRFVPSNPSAGLNQDTHFADAGDFEVLYDTVRAVDAIIVETALTNCRNENITGPCWIARTTSCLRPAFRIRAKILAFRD